MLRGILSFGWLLLATLAFAQSELSVEKIMQDPASWVGTSPSSIRWSLDSKQILYQWNPEAKPLDETYSYSVKIKENVSVPVESMGMIPTSGMGSPDGKFVLFEQQNTLYLYSNKKQSAEPLLNMDGGVESPYFIDNNTLGFSKGEVHYSFAIEDRYLDVVLKFEKAGHDQSGLSDQDAYLKRQQDELWLVQNERRKINELRDDRREFQKSDWPKIIDKPEGSIAAIQLNSKKQFAAISVYQPARGAKQTQVPHYVTESGYVDIDNARAKVGAPQGRYELYVYSLQKDTLFKVDFSKLPGIKEQPEYFSDYPERILSDSTARECKAVNATSAIWSPDGEKLLVNVLSDDNKDRWIALYDCDEQDLTVINHQHDEAWIGGPGIGGWSFWSGEMEWFSDSQRFWFQSEATGYSHLYLYDLSSGETKQLTSGEFEVYEPGLSKDENAFYLTANKENGGVRHFYMLPAEGGELVQLTSMNGNNEVTLSPDEKYLAIRYSSANRPWELYLQENKPGAEAIQITHSTTPEFESYDWRMPEFVAFEANDGAKVPARLYQPAQETKNGAAVIFVHGAGYLQNAHQWWSSYFREYQFHNLLCDLGYTVLDIDYRGSAGYGRDWRTAIYRHMGGKDLSDQVDGARFLVNEFDIDAERIGIYGGSYGGFITLMALFNYPEVFAAGAALRSVTDWAHYNHGYTENILNSPVLDSIAYRRSSPIYFAEGLKGNLLMCHGMVDDNVQFQDIVRLTQRLIELGKENWELAVYPVEPHGFKEPSSWTDEYKRILKLFEENLR